MGQGGLPKMPSGLDPNDLEQLKQQLKALQKSSENGDDEVGKMATTVEILHSSCKIRILSLAEKFAVSQVPKSVSLVDKPVEVEIPVKDSWDFKLGDWVRIRYPVSDFRRIQLKTLGWSPRLPTIHSFDSVVTKRWSSFENGVKIYTPTMLSVSVVYAGVLEKIPDSERKEKDVVISRWKVNDYVMIASDDDRAFKIIQRGLETIPEKLLKRRGRIIAVTKVAIVVTFNERTSYDVNSTLLTKCQDQETPLDIPQRDHEEGFGIGDKCKVISDIRKLVEYQSGHGAGWSADMTKLAGKQVTIIHIKKNGNLMVQYKQGGFFMMNPKCVVSLETPESDNGTDDQLLKKGDTVNVKLIEDIRDAIRKAKVPTAFLEYLRITAEVQLVDDDFDYLIRYNCNQVVNVYAPTIRKATVDEKEKHKKVKCLVKNIKIGSSVFLDVGPPSYVKAVLRGFSISSDVIRALTTTSQLVGYERGGKAVIEYEDGFRYKVNKKYLTVPEKFNMQSNRNGPSFDTIKSLQDNIRSTVAQKDTNAGDTSVEIISMSFDGPPFIDFRVYSNATSIGDISENLIDLDLEVKEGFDNWIYVSGLQCFEREIKISIFFNDEPYLHNFAEYEKSQTPNFCEELAQTKNSIIEGESSAAYRERMIIGSISDELQSPGVPSFKAENVQVRDSGNITLAGHKYLHLSGNVYLPLRIGEPADGELFKSHKISGDANNAGSSPIICNITQSNIEKIGR